MVVREKKNHKGQTAPLEDWKIKLQVEFPFLEQNPVKDEKNTYKRCGFECSGGWYQILRECCSAIVERYAEEGIGIEDIDFEPAQIKEKFGGLRFYYGYKDAPCGIAAFDNLSTGESVRLAPNGPNGPVEDSKAKLRQDIHAIIRDAEIKSRSTCEICGAPGSLRNVGPHSWKKTLCDECCGKWADKSVAQVRKKKES